MTAGSSTPSARPARPGGYARYAPTGGPARWLLIAGRRFVAAVESTVSDQIVDAVWWLAESELATIESVVGAFPLSGPDSVRSFAVAELGAANDRGERVVTAVVRGSAAVDVFSVGGSRRFSAGGVQPWVLAEFRNVTGLVVGGDDHATGPVAALTIGSLPLGLGVVDGELLAWSVAPIERVPRASAEAPAGSGPAAEETVLRQRARSSSVFGHVGGAGENPGAGEARPVAHELPGAVDIAAPPTATPPARAVVPPPAPRPGGVPGPQDAFPPTEPVVLPPAPPSFALRIGSAPVIVLDTPVLVGRRPAPLRLDTGAEPRLVAVDSPTQEVSGTHVRIEQEGEAVVVTDLRSTNGTVVVSPAGHTTRLRPGESVAVLAGTTISIGDGNIIEITAASAGLWGTDRPPMREDRREEGRP
ncbi:FHA domain-containing protein [Leifsonia sp. F6_8S_P_1B]|uniref:FHA domain-containing protein n=1 Tax=Leifsonia williamsii TaxID=3035919 RepID=A0ABT8KDX7_9MICO|nr:FHA domain-containing protein [Leifsonia williamsii]MDN4615178.1 FHA domain-containing protein [Leifsonia williamsii]